MGSTWRASTGARALNNKKMSFASSSTKCPQACGHSAGLPLRIKNQWIVVPSGGPSASKSNPSLSGSFRSRHLACCAMASNRTGNTL